MARFEAQRGNMRSGADDLADRWYIVDAEADTIDKRGSGYATRAEAFAALAERLSGAPVDDDLVGVAEIAERAGVKPATVQAWTERHATFPAPVQTFGVTRVWRWGDVAEWLAIPRKPGRPRQG
jgi:predicted DNA-binding transcriptional regulator AlpA